MPLKHDPATGLLAGARVDAEGKPIDEQTELLTDIQADTSELVGLARAHLRTAQRATVTPAGRAGPSSTWTPRGKPGAESGAFRVATPASRSPVSGPLPRDSSGRFVGRETMRLADFAAAADRLAQVGEQQRRDARADRIASPAARRDSSGRFLGGSQAKGGLFATPRLPSMAGAGQVDPLLAGTSEAASLLRAVGTVAVPQGRNAASTTSAQATGWLRAVWRELRGLRKDDAKTGRSTLAKLAELAKNRGRPVGEPGGMFGGLGRLLPALPALIAPLAAVGGGLGLALKAGSQLVRRIPLLGAALDVITGVAEDRRIASDSSLTAQQQRQQRTENAGSTLGGAGGALAGAMAGQALIPIPVVGAVVGAVAGGYLGRQAGRATGGAAARWSGGAKADIVGGANAAGVDPGLVAQIASFESGFNPGARPIGKDGRPMSSAHGYGQLLDATWVDTVRRHGQKHGIPGASVMSKEQALALRGDTKLQAAMLAELTAENVAKGRALGGKDDAANVYAMHNLGAGDGQKFLKALAANPSAPVASILGAKVISNNPSLYKDGSISVADAYANMGRKMAAGSQFAADARAAAPLVPPVAVAAVPKPAPIPQAPPMVAAAAIPAMPQVDTVGPQRLTSSAPAAAPVPPPPPSQDVRDRLIAHIVTGGIGGFGGIAHR